MGLLVVCSSVSEFFAEILHHGVFGAGLGLLVVCSSVSEFFAEILHHGVFGAGLGLLVVCSSVSEFFAEILTENMPKTCPQNNVHSNVRKGTADERLE